MAVGAWRGLVREVISILGWVIAFLAANLLAGPLGASMPQAIPTPELRVAAAFVAVFIASLVVTSLLGLLLSKIVSAVGLGGLDRSLGLLFGLGFDTASEVGLLGISAAQGSAGLPIWSILIFPALFTAGMSLIDTIDGVLMVRAYGWAFIKPVRKLYYNLTMTLISIIVALLIGSIEALGLLANKLGLEGRFWDCIERVNESFGALGYLIIGVFVAGWTISTLIYKIRRLDEVAKRLSEIGDQ